MMTEMITVDDDNTEDDNGEDVNGGDGNGDDDSNGGDDGNGGFSVKMPTMKMKTNSVGSYHKDGMRMMEMFMETKLTCPSRISC